MPAASGAPADLVERARFRGPLGLELAEARPDTGDLGDEGRFRGYLQRLDGQRDALNRRYRLGTGRDRYLARRLMNVEIPDGS